MSRRRPVSDDRAATEIRAVAARLAEVSAGARYAWWTGHADDRELVAGAVRAREELARAAERLAGRELGNRRLFLASGALLVLLAAGYTAVLAAVPDPGHPLVLAGTVAVFGFLEGILARWSKVPRRPARTPASAPPPDVAEPGARLRDILDRMAGDGDRAPHKNRREAAEAIETALMWLGDDVPLRERPGA